MLVRRRAALLDVLAVRRALELAVRVDPPLDLIELRLERLLRGLLHVQIERRVDPQALLVQIAAEAGLEERRPQPFDEVRGDVAVAGTARRQDQRIRLPELGVFGAQEVLVPHQVEDDVAAPHRTIGVGARIVRARGFRKRRQGRGFCDVQVARRLPKEHLRGGLDARDVGTEADLVQVQLENRVLGEVALQLDGDPRLPQLAGDLLLLTEVLGEHVARKLHRDRRKALRVMQRRDVGLERAEDAPVVDTVMAVKALILGRNERLTHVLGDLLERQDRAALDTELGDQPPVRRVDLRRLQLDVAPVAWVDPRDAGAALSGTDAGPRAIRQPAAVQQGQHGHRDHAAPLGRIIPPANDPGAATCGSGGGRRKWCR